MTPRAPAPLLISPVTAAELPILAEWLAAAGLPTDDLTLPGRRFWRVTDPGGLLGYSGLEGDGPDALLRSVVVPPDRRGAGAGAGAGRAVVTATIAEARRQGIERLWLLTTTAAGFFMRLGFQPANRASAPPPIANSAQFSGLCPGSAHCLLRSLGHGPDMKNQEHPHDRHHHLP